jgi:hypothetical protein
MDRQRRGTRANIQPCRQGAAKGGALGGVVYGDARVCAAHRSVEHTRKVPICG